MEQPTNGPTAEATYEVLEVSSQKRAWKLSLLPNRLRLDRGDGSPPFDVWRDEFPENVQVVKPLRALYVKLPLDGKAPKLVPFKLEPAVFDVVRDFIGPPTREHLRVELKKRLAYAIPIGLVCVALAFLPSPGKGVPQKGLKFDPFLLGIGALLAGAGGISRLAPHRVFFLAEAALFLLFAGRSVERLMAGGSWIWWPNLVLTGWLAFSNLRQFFRFADMRRDATEPTRPPPALPPGAPPV